MCGIVAVYGVNKAASLADVLLKALQHRGQEEAGISAGDAKGRTRTVRGKGLVDEVFRGVRFKKRLPGTMAIGHVQYSTSGEGSHPFVMMDGKKRKIAIAVNGNIRNYKALRKAFERRGACFQTNNDTEIFLHLMAQERANAHENLPLEELLVRAVAHLHGAFSVVAMAHDRVVALVDPHGFRPLVMGSYRGGTVIASETFALDAVDIEDRMDIPRGTVVVMNEYGTRMHTYAPHCVQRSCSFEAIYFSMPNTEWNGLTVHDVRRRLGMKLATRVQEQGIQADVAMPVPDSANMVSVLFAQTSGVLLDLGLVRNHYMGRTFITPHQSAREFGVSMKLTVVKSVVKGKRVLLVDDSLVRGTTLRKLIRRVRKKGATEVHVAIGAPPVIHPCSWGIDTPTRKELPAAQYTPVQIAQLIGADSLTYLTTQDLLEALEDPKQERHCITCFNGKLPVEEPVIPLDRLFRRLHAA